MADKNIKNKKEIRCWNLRAEGVVVTRSKDTDGNDVAKISGYAAKFNAESEDLGGFREIIQPGAFKNALLKSDTRALFNHDSNMVLGRVSAGTMTLKEDNTGLFMEVTPPDTQFARDLLVSLERGDIKEQSFGFTVKTDSWEEDRETGKTVRTLIEINELFDVSPVTFPAYPDTTVAKRSLEGHKKSADTSGDNKDDTILKRRLAEDEKREKYLKTKGYIK